MHTTFIVQSVHIRLRTAEGRFLTQDSLGTTRKHYSLYHGRATVSPISDGWGNESPIRYLFCCRLISPYLTRLIHKQNKCVPKTVSSRIDGNELNLLLKLRSISRPQHFLSCFHVYKRVDNYIFVKFDSFFPLTPFSFFFVSDTFLHIFNCQGQTVTYIDIYLTSTHLYLFKHFCFQYYEYF